MKSGIALLAVLCAVPCSAQLSPRDGFVVTEKEAFGLMPASLVAAPTVRQLEWSPDGQYVLAVRESIRLKSEDVRRLFQGPRNQPPPGEVQLIVWSARTQTSQIAWKADMGAAIEVIYWIPKSDVAFVIARQLSRPDPTKPPEYRRHLSRVSLANATVREIADISDMPWVLVYPSPTQPIALVHKRTDLPPEAGAKQGRSLDEIFILRPSGALGLPIALPDQSDVPPTQRFHPNRIQWSKDGFTPYLGDVDREATIAYNKANTQKKTFWRWLSLNPTTGRIQPVSDPVLWQASPPVGPIELANSSATTSETAPKKRIPILWLQTKENSKFPRAMVASGASKGALSPAIDGILYDMQGAAWVTPILRIDRDLFDKALVAAMKMEAISNAKQLGLAALMRAQDYDETLEGPDGINEKLMPYCQNGDLFNGFSWTYGGGPLSGINEPANTELGYVTGPGGRAVIFADGHVTWRSD